MADDTQTGADTSALDTDNAPQLTELEQVAVEMGWDPNHKSPDGKPGRSAKDWVVSADRMARNQKREISDLKKSIDRIIDATDKQVKREVADRAKEIEERFAAAVEEKDTQGAAKAANDMRALEAEQQKTAPKGQTADDRFAEENPWYGTNRRATAIAVDACNEAAAAGKSEADQLKAAREAVREVFPALFEAKAGQDDDEPAPRKTLALNNPGRPGNARKSQGFADLPEIARNAANRTYEAMKMRNGDKVPDRKAYEAQYAKDYYGEQAA